MTMVRSGVIVGVGGLVFTFLLFFTASQLHASSKKGQVSTLMMPRDSMLETYSPDVSLDGRWIAYEHAQHWGDGAFQAIRLFDSQNRTFIEFAPRSAQGCGGVAPVVSADGRYVAFGSCQYDLAGYPTPPPAPCHYCSWLFLYDTETGDYELLSLSDSGLGANASAIRPALSNNNRYVVFESPADTLVANDSNQKSDIFLRDRETAQTVRLSVGIGNSEANGDSSQPAISADGNRIVFQSTATNLVPDDTNTVSDVFLYTRSTGTIQRISMSVTGTQSEGDSHAPAITSDGNHISFLSDAANLVPNDTNGRQDLFLYSLNDGSLRRVSFTPEGTDIPQDLTKGEITRSGNAVLYAYQNDDGTAVHLRHDLNRCQINHTLPYQGFNSDASIIAYPDRVLAYRECEDPQYCRVTQVWNERGWDIPSTMPLHPSTIFTKNGTFHPSGTHFLYLPITTGCRLY